MDPQITGEQSDRNRVRHQTIVNRNQAHQRCLTSVLMRVLVTGATGIGGRLAPQLIRRGHGPLTRSGTGSRVPWAAGADVVERRTASRHAPGALANVDVVYY